ncbi:MAG TPA: hypothetical protein ENN06_01440, partial [Desulfobacteraceae bacterium]|nr:hypothetical protein [Desulfobacteraceae bacterium]
LQQYKVWVTDGSEAGTFVLKDFRPGASFEGYFVGAYQDELYLIVNDGVHAVGLWKTDGSPEGTVKVKGIDTNPSGTFYSPVLVYRDRLYFSCRDSVHGVELWGTDGTEAGTYILKDIAPGPADIDVKALAIVNDLLFLDLAVGGQGQPWISDGTEGGTVPLSDWEGVNTLGHFKTQPLYLRVIRNTLLFAAGHPVYDVEPFFFRMDRGDTNLDGSINLPDFRVLAEHWLSGSSITNYWGQYSDITDFGQVDLADLAALCENWAF